MAEGTKTPLNATAPDFQTPKKIRRGSHCLAYAEGILLLATEYQVKLQKVLHKTQSTPDLTSTKPLTKANLDSLDKTLNSSADTISNVPSGMADSTAISVTSTSVDGRESAPDRIEGQQFARVSMAHDLKVYKKYKAYKKDLKDAEYDYGTRARLLIGKCVVLLSFLRCNNDD